jgi:hypothetical protein
MKINENNNWNGKYCIKRINAKTKEVIKEEIIYNRILNTALDEMAKALYDGSDDLVVGYLGVGTTTASVYNTTTSLGSETFRTAAAIAATISNIGEVKNTFYLLNTEAKFHIREMGIYAGSTATVTIGTGKLISIISWDYDKTSVDEEVQITRYDSFNRSTKVR